MTKAEKNQLIKTKTKKQMEKSNLPTLADLTQDLATAYKTDQLNLLLNQQPPKDWIKIHPFIRGYTYLPIDKVEHLLRKIFKSYKIEITGQGTSFNGVWVTTRVHFLNPVTNDWSFYDGIGATQLQTAKGTSPSDLININNGALSMAFPIAKTMAIKDACDHFGSLFGANLNRNEVVVFSADAKLGLDESAWDELKQLFNKVRDHLPNDEQLNCERVIINKEKASFNKLTKFLTQFSDGNNIK